MALTLTAPVQYQIFQRNINGYADITITGTATGNGTDVQASWNGGAWSSIDTTADLAFSGSLTNQTAGQGTLEIREGAGAVEDSAADVGVGDIFVGAGQSNMSGRGTNNQSYSHGSLKATLFHNDYTWDDLADPTDDPTGAVDTALNDPLAAGSYIPKIATDLMASTGVPCAFVPSSIGGRGIDPWWVLDTQWDRDTYPGSTTYRAVTGVGGVRLVLWHQGETDAIDGVSANSYETSMDTVSGIFMRDIEVHTMVCKLQKIDSTTTANRDAINTGIQQAWDNDEKVTPGPDFSDMEDDDGNSHFNSDASLTTAGGRFATRIIAYLKEQDTQRYFHNVSF